MSQTNENWEQIKTKLADLGKRIEALEQRVHVINEAPRGSTSPYDASKVIRRPKRSLIIHE